MKNTDYPFEELIPIVAELASKYTSYEHTSIPYEKAQMLMGAVLYCMDEYKESAKNALLTDRISAKEAYQCGQEIVNRKTRKLRDLYNALIPDFYDYGCKCLKKTIKEIPAFLLNYDHKYAPQETLLIPGYPVLKDLSSLSGVDFVLAYMECICLEQQFLKRIDTGYVFEILRAYHSDYEELAENICEIVFQNAIVHILLGKPFDSKSFDIQERKELEHILQNRSAEEMSDHIKKITEQFIFKYYDGDALLTDYLACSIPDIIIRLKSNLKN